MLDPRGFTPEERRRLYEIAPTGIDELVHLWQAGHPEAEEFIRAIITSRLPEFHDGPDLD